MSDLAIEVAQAAMPLLAAGADGVVAEVTRQAGEGAAAATRRVLETIRSSVKGENPTEEEVASVVREGLTTGALSRADVEKLMAVTISAGNDYRGVRVEGNAYIDSSIRVDGGGSFHG